MKNVNDRNLAISVVLLLIALFIARAAAGNFEYKGVFPLKSIFINICEDCYMELPTDYLNTEVVLSVNTDDTTKVFKALQASSKAVGWELQRGRDGRYRAAPTENVGNIVFISCMDNQPHNVPKYLYAASVESDKIQCRQRDSLAAVARKKAKIDSMRIDSLLNIPPLDFANYQLKYYSYSKSFADRMGVEWGSLIASGNLHDKLQIFDEWRLVATNTNDTAYTERALIFSVDSTLNVDWGSEEQTLKQTFVNNGVTTQDYEWRKYGMIVKIKRDGKRVRMDYIFRDKENSISVLQGSVIGDEGDTLRLVGTYTAKRHITSGVPLLSSIPLLGVLFRVENDVIDNRAFELYLLPKKAVKDDRQDSGIVQRQKPAVVQRQKSAVPKGG